MYLWSCWVIPKLRPLNFQLLAHVMEVLFQHLMLTDSAAHCTYSRHAFAAFAVVLPLPFAVKLYSWLQREAGEMLALPHAGQRAV